MTAVVCIGEEVVGVEEVAVAVAYSWSDFVCGQIESILSDIYDILDFQNMMNHQMFWLTFGLSWDDPYILKVEYTTFS